MSDPESIAAVEVSLRRRFRVVETTVRVGRTTLEILHPASAEDLIDERDFDLDERLPYWAELWPSSRVLGESVLHMTGGGRALLELGCGAGLVTTCASLAGFDVVASDYYIDACRFARVNAVRNDARPPDGMLLDWRALPSDLPRFDVVIASDVLYERTYGEVVANAIDAALSENGVAYLADPGRVGRGAFLDALGAHDLRVRSHTDLPFTDGHVRQTIALFEISRGLAA